MYLKLYPGEEANGLLHQTWNPTGRGRGRSEAGWHMRGVFIAERVWFGLVWFGRQLLNTVVEQVLKEALAFPA